MLWFICKSLVQAYIKHNLHVVVGVSWSWTWLLEVNQTKAC